MRVAFYNDPDSGQPHVFNHGVSEAEVLDVFRRSPMHLHGREGTMIALGQTSAGRHLKMIYRRRAQDILVITAYDLRGNELKAFRRRRRRRD